MIGAVQRSAPDSTTRDIVVCAAGTLPAELHKLWRTETPGGYHMEYGYSCMGYEIAGGLGVKMARPQSEVIVMVGDGSYLMLNAEIATSLLLDRKLIIVVLDNRGYGCINRLQQAVGGEPFNNLFADCVQGPAGAPRIDFAANAASLGAIAENVKTIPELEAAMKRARAADRTMRDLHRDRSGAHDRRRRLVVGGRGARSLRARSRCAPSARNTSKTSSGSSHECQHTRPPAPFTLSLSNGRKRETSIQPAVHRATLAHHATDDDLNHQGQADDEATFAVKIGINPISWSNDDLPSLGGETPLEVALSEGRRSATRASNSATNFPASRQRCAACCRSTVWSWCRDGIRAGSRNARWKRRSPPSVRTSSCSPTTGPR